jgi:acyl-CoA synthetase (AMP-forming)/AMP-acid ligase II
MPEVGLLEVVERHVATRPHAIALVDGAQQISYAQLQERWRRCAGALVDSGLELGDRVAVLDWNSVEYVELLLACAHAGTVLVPLNARLAAAEHAAILRSARPRLLIVRDELTETARLAVVEAGLDDITVIVVSSRSGEDEFGEWRNRERPPTEARRHSILCLAFTSGSTGLPKGVMVRQESLAFFQEVSHNWGFDESAAGLVALPLFHIGGISWMMFGLLNGGRGVLLKKPTAAAIMDAVQEAGVTHINVVPAILASMLEEHYARPRDVTSLRAVTCGGAPVPEAYLRAAFAEFGCSVTAFYGLTEACGAVSYQELPPELLDSDPRHRLLSSGQAIEGMSIRIHDPATNSPVPAGVEGEVVIATPTAMAGYWHDPEQTAHAIDRDGLLHTGDVGYLDDEGFLFIRGRLKDVIISGGENIYAAEVENVITQHEGVLEACVVAQPHERWGETPAAMVVCDDGSTITPDALVEWCRERMAHYKCPTRVEIVAEIPRTATGKYAKNVVRGLLGAELAGRSVPPPRA